MKGQIGVTTDNIFPVIKKFLYSDHEIFIREIVSNAADACQKLKVILSDKKDTTYNVNVTIDKEKHTISVSDNGIGMNKEDIEKYINQIAFSGASEFLEKYKNTDNIIGHFGLGFYSSFMVSDKVHIYTRKYDTTDKSNGWHWSCDGSTEYEIEQVDIDDIGTTIVMEIAEEFREQYLDFNTLKELLTKYSRFLPVPLTLNEGNTHSLINDIEPIWLKKPSSLKDEDYIKFYEKMYPGADRPAFWIHLNVDFPFNLSGILYFPVINTQVDIKRNKVYLYSNNVFVTDHIVDILPDYLTLLHGVIDSPNIPLNVSRSYLQSDAEVKKISNHISKKVADKLKQLIKKDRNKYQEIWNKIKVFINYGILTQDDFFDKIKSAYLFKTTDNEYYTIDEYTDIVKDIQKDKDDNIVYLYATDLTMQYRSIKEAVNKGYKVIYLNDNLTTPLVNMFEHKNEKYKFVRVDSGLLSDIIKETKSEDITETYTPEQRDMVSYVFMQKRPTDADYDIFVNAIENHSTNMPCEVTSDETVRRLKDIELQGAAGQVSFGDMKYRCTLNINLCNSSVMKIADNIISNIGEDFNKIATIIKNNNKKCTEFQKDKDKEQEINSILEENKKHLDELQSIVNNYKNEDDTIAQLFDLGLIEVGLLTGERLLRFIERSAKFF